MMRYLNRQPQRLRGTIWTSWVSALVLVSLRAAAAAECGIEGTLEEKLAECSAKLGPQAVYCRAERGFGNGRNIPCEHAPAFREEGFTVRRNTVVTFESFPTVTQVQEEQPVGALENADEASLRLRQPDLSQACTYRISRETVAMKNCANASRLEEAGFAVNSWARDDSGAAWRNERTGRVWSAMEAGVRSIFSAMSFCSRRSIKGQPLMELPNCGELAVEVASGLGLLVPIEEARGARLWCRVDGSSYLYNVTAQGHLVVAQPFDRAGVVCAARSGQ